MTIYRYFIKLSYNGTRYHGWQIQPNAITVQGDINKALSLLMNETLNVVGCGRTDTGVHALDFYAHFDSQQHLSEKDLLSLTFKLNRFLNADILIYHIHLVDKDKHARFDAILRTYHYVISTVKNPFEQETIWVFERELDVEKMNKAAKILFSYKDFTSFSKLHTQTNNNLCDIYKAEWFIEENKLTFVITANRFLRNMVRSIVGTLIEIGLGKLQIEDIHSILIKKDRREAGFSVPAKGLFLQNVQY